MNRKRIARNIQAAQQPGPSKRELARYPELILAQELGRLIGQHLARKMRQRQDDSVQQHTHPKLDETSNKLIQ